MRIPKQSTYLIIRYNIKMSPVHYIQFLLFNLFIHLFVLFSHILYYNDYLSSDISKIDGEYDFIIVGAGTAGSLIGHRMSVETNYTFIILEAGSRSHTLLDIPVLGPLLHGSIFDWNYETVPQEYACQAMNNNRCKLPQGKIIGGSTKLNNMIHIRGNISHYVDWFHGKYSKSYLENHFDFIESKILHINSLEYESELSDAIMEAAKELGYSELGNDFSKGFMKIKVTQKNGKRWSPADNLYNKHIVTNILVEKVIFNGNTANGVVILHGDQKVKVYARKGVILSAGTYNTPKILQLSGIGPSEKLTNLGIPVLKDLPVGKHLQDHIGAGLDLILFNKSLSINALNIINPLNLLNYFVYGKGPLTVPGCEVVGFLSTKNETIPDIQFMVLPVGISADRGSYLRKTLGINDNIWENYFMKTFNEHSATILPVLLHPKSEGEVIVSSTNPYIPPLINPKYLANKNDVDILRSGLKLVTKFLETNAMKSIGAYINPIPLPGCEDFLTFSDSYWDCYLRYMTSTSFHPVGTCSMGLQESEDSVVDTSFRVIGLKNLYVVDGSVLPTLPSGNINGAIALMANVIFETICNTNVETNPKVSLNYNLYEYFLNMCSIR